MWRTGLTQIGHAGLVSFLASGAHRDRSLVQRDMNPAGHHDGGAHVVWTTPPGTHVRNYASKQEANSRTLGYQAVPAIAGTVRTTHCSAPDGGAMIAERSLPPWTGQT
jgi:hypothetical protein